MPAIRNSVLKITFSMLLLLVFFSCEEKAQKPLISRSDEITFVGLSNVGGDMGYYRVIKITKDSIHAEQKNAARKVHQQWNSAISSKTWKQLVSSINIQTLDKVKSSPSVQPVDGTDETFQIKTLKKSHVYVNSYVDTIHYKQLQKLKSRIEEILPKEYK
jgi:GTP-binding protein EngB required for normal cell division